MNGPNRNAFTLVEVIAGVLLFSMGMMAIVGVIIFGLRSAVKAQAATSAAAPADVAKELADGEVRRIDKGQGKVNLRHGEIKHLDMPPMTMVFQVRDRALLNAVSTGAKVRFRVEQIDGAYVVTAIEPAR